MELRGIERHREGALTRTPRVASHEKAKTRAASELGAASIISCRASRLPRS
jgi:hypothetical protein